MSPGETRVSPFISHSLDTNNVGIILSIVQDEVTTGGGGLETSLIGGLAASASKLVSDGSKLQSSLLSGTDITTQISQTPTDPTPFPGPGNPTIPILTSTVKTGDAVQIEGFELPYVMAYYPAATQLGFTVKIQDNRFSGVEKDWTVRWWAVAGTISTGTVTVPSSGGGQTSLTADTKKDDDGTVIKTPLDVIDPPLVIKDPVDVIDPPIIKLPIDGTPIIKIPVDDTPIIRQPIEQISALRTTDNAIDSATLKVESAVESEAIDAKLASIDDEPVKKTRRSTKSTVQPVESASDTNDTNEV
jgi:hypothetical protein